MFGGSATPYNEYHPSPLQRMQVTRHLKVIGLSASFYWTQVIFFGFDNEDQQNLTCLFFPNPDDNTGLQDMPIVQTDFTAYCDSIGCKEIQIIA